MATVRISKQLIEDVESAITGIANHVFEATIKPLDPSNHKDSTDQVVEAAMCVAWKDHMHLRSVVPQDWLKTCSYIDAKFVGVEEFRITKTIYVPPTVRGYTYMEVELTPEQAPEFYSHLVAFRAAVSLHKVKFDGIKKKVVSFLGACKSLKDALNKYPDLALYIPQKYKDQMEVVSERAQKVATTHQDEAMLTDEDRELITSNGVIGAIYNSNKIV